LKLTTDRHEASCGLFATAELLIKYKKRSFWFALFHLGPSATKSAVLLLW